MNTDDKIRVMQAFVEGKNIEFRGRTDKCWQRAITPIWNWHECEYRVARDIWVVQRGDNVFTSEVYRDEQAAKQRCASLNKIGRFGPYTPVHFVEASE